MNKLGKLMTIEEKAQAYDEALERANIWQNHLYESGDNDYAEELSYIFPQLKDDDNRIRKEILSLIKYTKGRKIGYEPRINQDEMIAWLEKQVPIDEERIVKGVRRGVAMSLIDYIDANTKGMCLSNMECEDIENAVINEDWGKVYRYMKKKFEKQEEPQVYITTEDGETITYSETDGYKVVEPKFHEGQWITDGEHTWKILGVNPLNYTLQSQDGNVVYDGILYVDEHFHLFTIEDAKDGDILVFNKDTNNDTIVIFKNLYNATSFHSYCYVEDGEFFISNDDISNDKTPDWCRDAGFQPATKKQCNLLFQKMKEEGYEWDADKKEPKKIHVIDDSKAEMDYCFTKMMNGEKVSTAWVEEDETNFRGIMDEIEANKNNGPDYDVPVYNRYLCWLESIKQRIIG